MKKTLDKIKISLIIFIALGVIFIILQSIFFNQKTTPYLYNHDNSKSSNNVAKALHKLHEKKALNAKTVDMYTDFPEFKAQYGTIKYFSRTEYDRAIDYSSSLWNSVVNSVELERTFNKNEAELIFLSDSKLLDKVCSDEDNFISTCLGAVTNNNASADNPGIIILRENKSLAARALMLKTITHEIGHYLGLTHNEDKQDKCSVMQQGVPCVRDGKVFANFAENDFKSFSALYKNIDKKLFLSTKIHLNLTAFEALEKS